MLLNYIISLVSVFIIIFVISDLKSLYEDINKEIHYIRKDIENLIDEKIQSIIEDEIDEIKQIERDDNYYQK